MGKVMIVYHSSLGHTRQLAEAVLSGVQRVQGGEARLLAVQQVDAHWEQLHDADAIIFGAPVCMGSLSAPFKQFMDATAAFCLAQPWRNKLAAGFVHSDEQCNDTLASLLQLAVFAARHAMVWVSLGLVPDHRNSPVVPFNRPGSAMGAMFCSSMTSSPADRLSPTDRGSAADFGERIACLASRHCCGFPSPRGP